MTGPIRSSWAFYVDRAWHGRGVAALLMDAEPLQGGRENPWLGVERNDRARAFYVKCGFVDAGEHISVRHRSAD